MSTCRARGALEEIQSRIRTYAQGHAQLSWIHGRGWAYEPFPGGLPTREQLDAVVPDRPAVMRCFDGHSIWVNSKALAAAGITRNTPDPPQRDDRARSEDRRTDGCPQRSARVGACPESRSEADARRNNVKR